MPIPHRDPYVNVREILGDFIGLRIVDITQHDKDEFAETQQAYVSLHFDTGQSLTFFISERGFDIDEGPGEADDEDDTEAPG